MIDVTDAADVTDGSGASGEFDQLINLSEVGQPPAIVRAGRPEDIRSHNAMSSPLEPIGDMGSNETSGTRDNDSLHAGREGFLCNKYCGKKL
jgi:hypothetical protein